MAEILHFTPRAILDARTNLNEFIQWCKTSLHPFGRKNINFDENIWPIAGLTAKGNLMQNLYFTSLGNEVRGSKGKPGVINAEALLKDPFLDFAKAIICYMHYFQPTKAICDRYQTLRYLETALLEINKNVDSTAITPKVLNRACSLMLQNSSYSTAYQRAIILESIYNYMLKLGLVSVPLIWKNPIRPIKQNRNRIGKEFDETRYKKLPDPITLEALAEIFTSDSKDPTEIVASSLCALMLCCPDRATECLFAPLNCFISDWKDSQTDELGTGLRWFPLKGGAPMVKTVIPSMRDIAKNAVEKLRKLSEPARTVARWYEAHPNDIYLPTELEYLRNKIEISTHELGQLLFGGNPKNDPVRKTRVNLWIRRNNLQVKRINQKSLGHLLFSEIESTVLKFLPKGFPVFDPESGMLYSEALCIVRPFELNSKTHSPLICGILPIRYGNLAGALKTNNLKKSIFEKRNLKGKNGQYLFITTHMLRHYLNTLVRQGGMLTEAEISEWSGRGNIRHNHVYNHISDRDQLTLLRNAVGNPSLGIGPLTNINNQVLIKRDEFANLKIMTAHTTQFGQCIHDYAKLPCQIHADCINCNEHLIIKGDVQSESNIRSMYSETKVLLENAKIAMNEKEYGANIWVDTQTKTLERVSELISILDNSDISNGTVIQLSGVLPASRLAQAHEEKIHLTRSIAETFISLTEIKTLLENKPIIGKLI